MGGYRTSLLNQRVAQAMAVALILVAIPAAATSLEKAKRIHDRLAGVPPSAAVLAGMQTKIDNHDEIGAAYDAMSNKAFYNAKLKNWITPWTNREGNKFAPLNDSTATAIGLIRDSKDYRKVLYEDILYIPDPATYGAYAAADNKAYIALEAADADLSNPTVLVETSQSAHTGIPNTATAGIMTTRGAARAFFIDGTNRAMFRFTLKNHLCHDMEQVQETTRPTDRIRQDVPRSPGGDSRIFMNTCVGCHSGMDPMAQAFAYYNFKYDTKASDQDAAKEIGQLTYKDIGTGVGPGGTEKKYHINTDHFIDGFITTDDSWDNYWRDGPNTAIFGWSSVHSQATGAARTANGIYGDAGAKTMGEELANSEAFAVCSVKKVFQAVCLRDPASGDQSAFTVMLNNFKSGYDLKHTFAEAAVYCSDN